MKKDKIKCYHISHIKNRDSILKKGLIPGSSEVMEYKKRLFFSTNKETLGFDYVDYINVDIWSFELTEDEIIPDKDGWSKFFAYTSKKISKNKIKLEKTIL
jgi:hypothetical protein